MNDSDDFKAENARLREAMREARERIERWKDEESYEDAAWLIEEADIILVAALQPQESPSPDLPADDPEILREALRRMMKAVMRMFALPNEILPEEQVDAMVAAMALAGEVAWTDDAERGLASIRAAVEAKRGK